MISDTKVCRGTCKQARWFDQFNKCSRSIDGLKSWCKLCVNEYNRDRQYMFSQSKFEARYKNIDPAIGFCKCGDYFKRIYFEGTSFNVKYRSTCKNCS